MNKRRIYTIATLGVFVFLIWFFFEKQQQKSESPELVKIALREVGNQILLKQLDSTSLVLPVVAKEASMYELSFERPISFRPNHLVTYVSESFEKVKLTDSYQVETINCDDHEVAYSYQMSQNQEETLVPCAGRELPVGCYTIQVRFASQDGSTLGGHWLLYLLLFLLFIAFEAYFYLKKGNQKEPEINTDFEAIGSFKFYPEQNKLIKEAVEIGLSKKECELLAIFISQPNQVIKRDELTKRVWEDNGVIVGRSLDTYVSKLRKKLSDDDRIKITNVHGVGYKLEVKR
ncbi:MAG: winged helix-turn-helix domain-containing protein [Gilvibacter sp.]